MIGPRCISSIAGPVIFVLRRVPGMHQLYLETS
jgi:hypothetical protein